MKFVIIFGPPAVGKMTVGQELAKITDLKLFHNHMTIDLVSNFFSYDSEEGKRLVNLFRHEIFEEACKSSLSGLIFTYVWVFNNPTDSKFIYNIVELLRSYNAEICFVELETPIEIRLQRNRTENRLKYKPSKRNIELSNIDLQKRNERYRMNSYPGEFTEKNYLRIDNSEVSAEDTAKIIKAKFRLF